jgi:hypothetical protein
MELGITHIELDKEPCIIWCVIFTDHIFNGVK